jgi:hypothetical protein
MRDIFLVVEGTHPETGAAVQLSPTARRPEEGGSTVAACKKPQEV